MFIAFTIIFYVFDRKAEAYENLHIQNNSRCIKLEKFDSKQMIQTLTIHSLTPPPPGVPSRESRIYAAQLNKCWKCRQSPPNCERCHKCVECHKCYMCHVQKLSCHECKHQNSGKKCHLCRCKACVDAKKQRKKEKEEEKRRNYVQERPEQIPEQRVISYPIIPIIVKEYPLINNEPPLELVEKVTPLDTEEQIEDYLKSLGITVSYEYTSWWNCNEEIVTSDWQIWPPANNRKIYLSKSTQDEMREDMGAFLERGNYCYTAAKERLIQLPLVSTDEALAICITGWTTVLASSGTPQSRIISAFYSSLGVYGVMKITEGRQIYFLFQEAYECYKEAENLQDLLDRCE